MPTPPRMATRWAVQKIAADGTLPGLIASGKAWQVIPRSVDTQSKPGVVVGIQSAAKPTYVLDGLTQRAIEQTLMMRVQVQQTTSSTQQIEAVETAIIDLLNGRSEAVTGGQIIYCEHAGQSPDQPEDTGGDLRTLTSTLLFEVSAKVNS